MINEKVIENVTNIRCRWRIGNEFGRKTVGDFTKRLEAYVQRTENESVGERIVLLNLMVIYIPYTLDENKTEEKRERERKRMIERERKRTVWLLHSIYGTI